MLRIVQMSDNIFVVSIENEILKLQNNCKIYIELKWNIIRVRLARWIIFISASLSSNKNAIQCGQMSNPLWIFFMGILAEFHKHHRFCAFFPLYVFRRLLIYLNYFFQHSPYILLKKNISFSHIGIWITDHLSRISYLCRWFQQRLLALLRDCEILKYLLHGFITFLFGMFFLLKFISISIKLLIGQAKC